MKIVCSKAGLVKGVGVVSKAVSVKTTMPILECILIDAADEIKLAANDLELGIETTVDGSIIEKGSTALNARVLSDIVRKLPESDVTIETDSEDRTIITCEKSRFSIAALSGNDFSYLPDIEKEDYITVSEFTLKEIIRQTIFSISESDANKILTGELFEINGNTLKVVALDGHRVAIRKTELKNSYSPRKVIVPGKTLLEISKIMGQDADSQVDITFTKTHIVFEFDRNVVISRLIEGNYINIDHIISRDYESKVVVNNKELLDCIDRASLLTREGDKKPVIINIGEELMDLKIRSQIGSMEEEIGITKEGKDIKIGFNPKFLIDVLRVIDDEEISLYFMNPKTPCFIKDDAQNYIYLIFPVNFTEID